MSLFPSGLQAIPTRFRLEYIYNDVTRSLLLSGQASEKIVRICIVPNTILKVEIFNAHFACRYSLTQNFGVKVVAYSSVWPQRELGLKEMWMRKLQNI